MSTKPVPDNPNLPPVYTRTPKQVYDELIAPLIESARNVAIEEKIPFCILFDVSDSMRSPSGFNVTSVSTTGRDGESFPVGFLAIGLLASGIVNEEGKPNTPGAPAE